MIFRRPATREVWTYLAVAVVAFGVAFVVGALVSNAPPGAIDRSALRAYGVAVPIARFFTRCGRFPAYLGLCTAALVFGLVRRAWLSRVSILVVGLVCDWRTSDLAKVAFHRIRPPHPIVAEASFGYPSGHADLSIFFYGLIASYVWRSTLDRTVRLVLVGSLAFWIGAIGWSRLSLGAHYPSDVLGGYAFGTGWLALAWAVVAYRAPSRVARHASPAGSSRLKS